MPGSVEGDDLRVDLHADAFAAAEEIASRDRNNLYLTSRFFVDREKYRAFCAYYAVMRVVDDRIDGLRSRGDLSTEQRRTEHYVLSAWYDGVRACYRQGAVPSTLVEACDRTDAGLLFEAFAESLTSFRPPPALWENFFGAMRWDLEHERFDSWKQFLTYAEGASVAPTTIYLFLIAARRRGGSTHLPEGFDVVECGRQLGLFAYLGHIVRDLGEDLRSGQNGLIYISREDMVASGVTEELLRSDLELGRAGPATRQLVADIVSRARHFLAEGRAHMTALSSQLDRDCEFILELIVTVYVRVLEKIEASSYDPMGTAHRLTFGEKRDVVREVSDRLGVRVPARQPAIQQEPGP